MNHIAIIKSSFSLALLLSLCPVADAGTSEENIFDLIREGQAGKVRVLITEKPEILKATDTRHTRDFGWTPLHAAANANQEEIVAILLEAGADPTIANSGGSTPLHIAAGMCGTATLQRIVGTRTQLPLDTCGSSPLWYAVRGGNVENARWLIARGSDVNEVRIWEGDGATAEPLITCVAPDPEMIRLLARAGADIDATGRGGKTLLREMAETDPRGAWDEAGVRESSLAALKAVLELGADTEIASADDGWTPLHAAVWFQNEDAVALMLTHGAKVDAKAADGRTPLDLARRQKFASIEKRLIEKNKH